MQGSPSGKLEDAFVVIRSTQKVVANMEVDREYNACKALDPQIDNEDDVHHSSPKLLQKLVNFYSPLPALKKYLKLHRTQPERQKYEIKANKADIRHAIKNSELFQYSVPGVEAPLLKCYKTFCQHRALLSTLLN